MKQLPDRLTLAAAVGTLAVLFGVGILAFSAAYTGRVLPGVMANGVGVGGLNREEAVRKMQRQAEDYRGKVIPVQYGQTTLRVPVSSLAPKYNEGTVDLAMRYGRKGGFKERFHSTLRAVFGRPTTVSSYDFDSAKLSPYLEQVEEDLSKPVANAGLSFSEGVMQVTPSRPGMRVDRGRLVAAIEERISAMSGASVAAPAYEMTPAVTEAELASAKSRAESLAREPLSVTAGGVTKIVDQNMILGWLDVSSLNHTDMPMTGLRAFYAPPTALVNLRINHKKVAFYAGELAKVIDKQPRDAGLSVQDGKVVVALASQDGMHLDQEKAKNQIIETLSSQDRPRDIQLATAVTRPAVHEGNLESLGLKEMIGRGESFFPGSSADRLVNVRVGTSRYSNVLIKPGQVFSFGAQLGDVGPAQGYRPSLVIVGTKEYKEYGGGLCQVSSTLYRAALNAGLPIVQRTNHSFAINEFYTKPYGAPGVDATIYYPAVDLKFKNDTPGYILIQTNMVGTSLTFDLYGTKTKSGRIRGPEFISGSMDSTKPSHTVFYRDVLDLSGNVVRTDTVHTRYKAKRKKATRK